MVMCAEGGQTWVLRVLLWAWMGEGYREGGTEWSHSTFPISGFQELRKMVAPTFGMGGKGVVGHPSRG